MKEESKNGVNGSSCIILRSSGKHCWQALCTAFDQQQRQFGSWNRKHQSGARPGVRLSSNSAAQAGSSGTQMQANAVLKIDQSHTLNVYTAGNGIPAIKGWERPDRKVCSTPKGQRPGQQQACKPNPGWADDPASLGKLPIPSHPTNEKGTASTRPTSQPFMTMHLACGAEQDKSI